APSSTRQLIRRRRLRGSRTVTAQGRDADCEALGGTSPNVSETLGSGTAQNPNQLNYTRQLLTEAPTAFFLTASVLLLQQGRHFYASVALSIAVLFRASLGPLLPLFFACGLWQPDWPTAKNVALRWIGGLAFGAVFYAALLSVGVIKPSNNLGPNLLISINSSQGVVFSTAGFSSEETMHPLRTYAKFASAHPAEFLKQRWLSLYELWGWPSDGDNKSPRSLGSKLLIALRLPLLFLGLVGFWFGARTREAWILVLPVLTVTVVHIATFSTPRFTYVVEPCLAVLAVAAVGRLATRRVPENLPELSAIF
ncbi:MAG: hypothetical protein U0587_18150, partial [Candidatus Binatia bacterium]